MEFRRNPTARAYAKWMICPNNRFNYQMMPQYHPWCTRDHLQQTQKISPKITVRLSWVLSRDLHFRGDWQLRWMFRFPIYWSTFEDLKSVWIPLRYFERCGEAKTWTIKWRNVSEYFPTFSCASIACPTFSIRKLGITKFT